MLLKFRSRTVRTFFNKFDPRPVLPKGLMGPGPGPRAWRGLAPGRPTTEKKEREREKEEKKKYNNSFKKIEKAGKNKFRTRLKNGKIGH